MPRYESHHYKIQTYKLMSCEDRDLVPDTGKRRPRRVTNYLTAELNDMKTRSQDIKAKARTHACNYPEKGITSASHMQDHKRVKLNRHQILKA